MSTHLRLVLPSLFAISLAAHAADPYKVGDVVEAWPDRDKSRLELCMIKAVLPEEKYRLSCGQPNTDLTLGSDFIRRLHPKTAPAPAPAAKPKDADPADAPPATAPPPP